ncbi:hypothetical protein [Streptomyces sp. NPDC006368]|uniref:hypothetical protein n=1 Tax=Streptomyces sp. NPDC006368 TaxID=3156760 RepID=UPI0033B168C3
MASLIAPMRLKMSVMCRRGAAVAFRFGHGALAAAADSAPKFVVGAVVVRQ